MAFIRSSLPTISTRNDCRARNIERIHHAQQSCQHKHMPDLHSVQSESAAARTKASSIDAICVRNHDCVPRLKRSAVIPPTGAKRNDGNLAGKSHRTQQQCRSVIRYTSHDCATLCIQVPISEISWPLKKSWKLRCRKARPATCQRDKAPAGGSLCTAGSFSIGISDSDTLIFF